MTPPLETVQDDLVVGIARIEDALLRDVRSVAREGIMLS